MELGPTLRAAREAAGLSLAAMAARSHFSKAQLGHLETGRRTVTSEHVTAYSRALGVPVASLYGPPDDPLRLAHEWLVTDAPVRAHLASGRRVGSSLAAELERRVVDLRLLDDLIGGCDLLPLVRKELDDAQAVVREGGHTAGIERRLLTVVGELSQLVGWVAGDAGRYGEAQAVYLSGVSAAQAAGDRQLAGQLLSCLSYQIANIGNPADAALLARTALKGVHDATSVVRALLLERVAWAAARARDADEAQRALDAVDDAYEHRSTDDEPGWVYWLNRAEIDVMAGRCLIELGEPAKAEPLLAGAIAGYDMDHAREVALYRTWLAEGYARTRSLDAARSTIALARRAADRVGSTRLAARVRHVERMALAGHRG